eukprot:COSAG01_NODE_60479_length_294_cov_1.323077_1_plen_39_part_01
MRPRGLALPSWSSSSYMLDLVRCVSTVCLSAVCLLFVCL